MDKLSIKFNDGIKFGMCKLMDLAVNSNSHGRNDVLHYKNFIDSYLDDYTDDDIGTNFEELIKCLDRIDTLSILDKREIFKHYYDKHNLFKYFKYSSLLSISYDFIKSETFKACKDILDPHDYIMRLNKEYMHNDRIDPLLLFEALKYFNRTKEMEDVFINLINQHNFYAGSMCDIMGDFEKAKDLFDYISSFEELFILDKNDKLSHKIYRIAELLGLDFKTLILNLSIDEFLKGRILIGECF